MYKGTIYSSPENYGLTTVGEFDWSEPDYSFDICVVWKERRGRYWVGNDSGCSCPSPFEDFYDMNQLDGPYTKDGLRKRFESLIDEGYHSRPKAELKREIAAILSRLS